MDITASLRFLRIAPRKVRLVANLLRGKTVSECEDQLSVIMKASSVPLLKLIRSAKANAKHNFDLDPETLFVKSIIVNDGPVLKRYMPRAHGAAYVIRKRSSHVHLVLAEKEQPKKAASKAKVINAKKEMHSKKTEKPKDAKGKKKEATHSSKHSTK